MRSFRVITFNRDELHLSLLTRHYFAVDMAQGDLNVTQYNIPLVVRFANLELFSVPLSFHGKSESVIIVFSARGRPGKSVQLAESEVRGLCLKSREIFLNQPILLELEAPLKICGRFAFYPRL